MTNLHWHIIGLGWLGGAWAEVLCKRGVRVSGTVRTKEKAMKWKEKHPSMDISIWNSASEAAPHIPPGVTHLLLCIPPSGVEPLLYAQALVAVARQLRIASPQAKLMFTSSTSVYPEASGTYSEGSMIPGEGSLVIQTAEKALSEVWQNLLIIRLSGLAGYGRVPGRFFAGKPVDGSRWVNLIHRDDILGFLAHLEAHPEAHGTVNLSCPQAVTRRELYALNAQQYGFQLPVFSHDEAGERRVVSERKELFKDFVFCFQSPLEFPI